MELEEFNEWWAAWSRSIIASPTLRGSLLTVSMAAWKASAPKWRPIETAPQHKTILLLTVFGDCVSGMWMTDSLGNGHWHDWGQEPLDQEVTHWMPMPPSPEEESA